MREAQNTPVGFCDAEQLIHPALEKQRGITVTLKLGAKSENCGQTLVTRGKLLRHQIERASCLPQFLGQIRRPRTRWWRRLRRGATFPQHQTILPAPPQVARLVGQSLDNKQPPAPLAVLGRELDRLGKIETRRVVGHPHFNPLVGDDQIHADGELPPVRDDVVNRVVRGLSQRPLPAVNLGGDQPRLGEKRTGLPAQFGHGVQVAGHFPDAGLGKNSGA